MEHTERTIHDVPVMQWEDRYRTGIDAIDTQHQAIVALINEVHAAISNREPVIIVDGIIRKLMAYAEEHFTYEEQCMELCEFAQLTAHRCRHKEMTGIVRQFEAAVAANETAVYPNLLEFLINWLRIHILIEDRRYVPDMERIGFAGTTSTERVSHDPSTMKTEGSPL